MGPGVSQRVQARQESLSERVDMAPGAQGRPRLHCARNEDSKWRARDGRLYLGVLAACLGAMDQRPGGSPADGKDGGCDAFGLDGDGCCGQDLTLPSQAACLGLNAFAISWRCLLLPPVSPVCTQCS
jgi:hypothetical protein